MERCSKRRGLDFLPKHPPICAPEKGRHDGAFNLKLHLRGLKVHELIIKVSSAMEQTGSHCLEQMSYCSMQHALKAVQVSYRCTTRRKGMYVHWSFRVQGLASPCAKDMLTHLTISYRLASCVLSCMTQNSKVPLGHQYYTNQRLLESTYRDVAVFD